MAATSSSPAFPIQEIPFSRYGSWFGVSPVVAPHTRAPDLHLVSHRNGMHPVLRLVPVRAATGERVPTTWHATPARLTWQSEGGRVEAVYDGTDALRLRGRGLGMLIASAAADLTPFSGTYLYRDPVDGSAHFTSYETGRRYRITLLRGAAVPQGAEALGPAARGVVLSGDEGGAWEAAVEEFDSARPPYAAAADFRTVAASAGAAFGDFAGALAAGPGGAAPAAGLAAYVLWSATVRPAGFVGRPAVLMSKHWMDKVWSWDHCFNALALAPALPDLAWHQFRLPFDHQDETGALPDSVTHSEVLYNFVKPPVHGWALHRLRERLPGPLAASELADVHDRLARWTDFWLTLRTAPGRPLPHYQHGNDSGWDNATAFDARRVAVTADLAAFLVLQSAELARTANELGMPDEALQRSRAADALQDALMEHLWSGGRFLSGSPDGGGLTASRSLLDLMPIVLGERLPREVADRLAERIAGHLTPYGLATEHPDSPHYEADGYWRGPIWAPSTVLVEDGLRRAGHRGLADEISRRFLSLCEKSGFAENFDALSGEGLRDRAYTWTASAYLLLADERARRGAG